MKLNKAFLHRLHLTLQACNYRETNSSYGIITGEQAFIYVVIMGEQGL